MGPPNPAEAEALRVLRREAEGRILRDLIAGKSSFTVFGLSIRQIAWLRSDYMKRGGAPSEIPDGDKPKPPPGRDPVEWNTA